MNIHSGVNGKVAIVSAYNAEGSNADHLHPRKLILRRISEKIWGTLNIEPSEQEEPGIFSLAQYFSTYIYTKF